MLRKDIKDVVSPSGWYSRQSIHVYMWWWSADGRSVALTECALDASQNFMALSRQRHCSPLSKHHVMNACKGKKRQTSASFSASALYFVQERRENGWLFNDAVSTAEVVWHRV